MNVTKMLIALACAAGLSGPAFAQAPPPAAKTAPPSASKGSATNAKYEELYEQYLDAARRLSDAPSAPAANTNWLVDLTSDPRARRQNDLVTIRIEENVTASGSADASLGKNSAAAVTLPSPLSKATDKIVPNGADTKFAGTGSTNRSSSIAAVLTARVSEVLPNGDLVLEGIREVDVNGDRQVVVLTGVVRPLDIATNNVVSSTRIGQLRIRSIGRGLIKDSLTPGWLVRILNKIF